MKAKLVLVASGVAAALIGFWAGSYSTRHQWERIQEGVLANQTHFANRGRAATAVSVLHQLAAGKHSEARDSVEMQLDLGVSGMLFFASNYSRTGLDSADALVLDQARSYRSLHPWSNSARPDLDEMMRRAFKQGTATAYEH